MTAPSSTPDVGQRIDALTGLRFVAAAVVLIEHFPQIVPGLGVVEAAQGGAGVSLFFVLSGFVLTHRYGARFAVSRTDWFPYVVARVARIVPLYLVSLVIIVPLVLVLEPPFDGRSVATGLVGLVANIGLVHAWSPMQAFHIWNGPSWSISVEMFFYATFPILIPAFVWPLLRRKRLGLAICLVGAAQIVTVVVVSLVAADLLLTRSGDLEGTRLIVGRIGQFPVLRLGEFAIGCLLGAAFRGEYRSDPKGVWSLLERGRGRLALLIAAAIGAAAIQFTPACPAAACGPEATGAAGLVDLRLFVVYLPVVVTVVAAVAWGASPVSRVLSTKPLVVLGDASYAIYILQWAAWLIINRDGEPTMAVAWVAVVATVGVALVVHRAVELPAQRRVIARWRPARA